MFNLFRRWELIAAFFIGVLIIPATRAEDFYVAQVALGGDTGSDAADAHSVIFFNTGSNWSSPTKVAGKIGPGDTVHLVGNITTSLTVQASGTVSNVITILFEPGAEMSVPAWANAGAIILFNLSYITIDGGSNGLIENTANGTNLANQVDSRGVQVTESSFITIQNLSIQNLYVRVKGSDQLGNGIGVIFRWNGGSNFSNDTVNNCTFHDMSIGVSFDYGPGCSNFTMSNCTAYNCNWGGNAGDHSNTSTLDGLSVHDNHFYNWDNWTDTSTNNSFHHNGFYGWSEQEGGTARLTTVAAFNNTVGPGFNSTASTSGLFFSGNVGQLLVYNNVFTESGPTDYPADGLSAIWIHDGNQTGFRVYNNTFAGGGAGIGIWFYQGNGLASTIYEAKNNIITNVSTAVSQFLNTSALLVSDYNNVSAISSAGSAFNTSPTATSAFESLGQWQLLGFDAHTTTVAPVFVSAGTGNFHLGLTDLAAVDNGTDLSAFFTIDKDGVTRPQGLAWDIGAYEQIPTSPVVTAQPAASQNVITGGNVTLSVAARGAPTLTYSWQKNGVTISNGGIYSGATSPTLQLTALSLTDAGNYTAVVSNGIAPNATSSIAVVNVGTMVVFTTQPIATQSIATGGTVILSAAATGTPSPTFQWQKGGVNLNNNGIVSGATTSTLTLTGITGVDAGTYTVVGTNTVSTVQSNNSVLTVTGTSAPVITTQPVAQVVSQGSTVNFSVNYAGTPAPSLQWEKNGVALSNGGIVSGATTNSLTLTGVAPSDDAIYTVTASNGVGPLVTSTGAMLTVNPTPGAPVFTQNPSNLSAAPGATIVFLVAASGVPSPSFQWQKNGASLNDGGNISGSSTASLTISNVSLSDGGTYSAVATNGVGSPVVSSGGVLTVTGVTPTATVQPTGQTILSGSSVSLTFGVNSSPTASFQWLFNGIPITGANNSTLTLSNVTTAVAGTYTAIATNSLGSVTSNAAILAVLIPSRLTNVSIRAIAGSGSQTLITGFVVRGGSKSILLRGIGPSLAAYGVAGTLSNPDLTLFNAEGMPIAMNSNWGGTQTLQSEFSKLGAFPLSASSSDDALWLTVDPGAYTAEVSGSNAGIALAEVYDADQAEAPAGRLINVSARAQIGTGENVAIAGFVIGGTTSEKILIRAIGPGLSPFGLTGVLAAPELNIYDSKSNLLQSNDGWGGSLALQAAFASVGAFPLSVASSDAALSTTLQPGSYTAIVSGANGSTGVALVEIYELQ